MSVHLRGIFTEPRTFPSPCLEVPASWRSACEALAASIAAPVVSMARTHTTVSIERASLRLLGVRGCDDEGVPWVNRLVDRLVASDALGRGVLSAWYAASGQGFDSHEHRIHRLLEADDGFWKTATPDPSARARADAEATRAVASLEQVRAERARRQLASTPSPRPLRYVIVASGDIAADEAQALAAVADGADVIAVIRTTAQSLLDFVPEGETFEGAGGTYATAANISRMRRALDTKGEHLGRYLGLCNYASGLCMPEIAAIGATERLDLMLNDALYGILFRDINPRRTLIDQHFSRAISALAGIVINTGEDNYLTTDDAETATHTVVASHFINRALAAAAGLPPAQVALGHAMEMDPWRPGMLVRELAQARLVRDTFPEHPLKYMPPTRHMSDDVSLGLVQDALFSLVAAWTEQDIQLLGMHTEGIHTPHLADRAIALAGTHLVHTAAAGAAPALTLGPGVQASADATQYATHTLLQAVDTIGLLEAIAQGTFARVRRPPQGGRGADGVATHTETYWNPLRDHILSAAGAA